MKYLQTYKIFEYNSENLYIKVFDKESYAKEIYNNEGNLKDPTYYDRILYSDINDLSWSSSDLKLMFIVLYLNDKIIGVCKIGNWDKNVPNKRSISYCSIDREYRGKKYLKYIVQKLMEVCKENDFILTDSRWTVPGYLILRKSLIKYSKIYGVEFIDHNNMHDAPFMYNKDLISQYEMTDDERKKHDQGDVYDKDLNESKGDGTKEGINILNNYIKDVEFNFPIKVVSKFTNIKYQDRYISRWDRNGFRINNFKKFESTLNENRENYHNIIKLLESFSKDINIFRKFNRKLEEGKFEIDLSEFNMPKCYINGFKKMENRGWVLVILNYNDRLYDLSIYRLNPGELSKLYEIILIVSGMKNTYTKMNEDKNIEIGHSSDYGNDGWKENTIYMSTEDFFNRWYKDKKHIRTEGNYDVYLYHHKDYSEKDEEYFWETKKILKVEKRDDDVTHYFEKESISKPLYKPRMEGMTIEQENRVRTWCGTKKNPKPHMGEFIGYEKGLAIMRSFLSDKINGKKYHILPDGNIVEMFRPNDDHINKEDDDIDKEYVQKNIDYLLDTKNFDLIHYIEGYMN